VARDAARIPDVIDALREYWLANPDLRLCQVIGNLVNDVCATKLGLQREVPDMSLRAYNIEEGAVLSWLVAQLGDECDRCGGALASNRRQTGQPLWCYPCRPMIDR
jgi:hypothetical protein